ncbi:MAG: hypothetical protein IPL12_18930 [Bacteroidetes bacterium]|nr:hypothetical protein [Bacteroidota bacterium]
MDIIIFILQIFPGDSSNLDVGNFMRNFIDGFTAKSTDTAFLNKALKYRFRRYVEKWILIMK